MKNIFWQNCFILIVFFKLPDKKGSAPIHLACKLGFEDILDLFINKMDAEMLLIADGSKMTILHLLCQDKVEKVTLVGKILSKLKTVSAKVKQVPSYLDRALSAQDINKQYFYTLQLRVII